MATMGYVTRGSVLVVVHSSAPPTPAEWTRFVEDYRAERTLISRVYVHTIGGGPSSSQRREIVEAIGDAPVRAVVLTDSLIARGMVTAMAWLKGDFIRAFPHTDSDGAMGYLEIDPAERPEIMRLVRANLLRLTQPVQPPSANVSNP